jgi:outer membrane protein TolC
LTLALCAACSTVERARDPMPLAPASPTVSWTPPPDTPPSPPFETAAKPDPETVYDLPALIDLALRANPETRRVWEQARAAAAGLGIAESAYLPTLAVYAVGGTARVEDRVTTGPVYTAGPLATTLLRMHWTLLDFGRRSAAADEAREELAAANFRFNRMHQEVAYGVERATYAYDASRARVTAAEATLASAQAVTDAADARMAAGLATRTEVLLARQELARAAFDLQAAHRGVADARAALADALGISPAMPLEVVDLSALPLPPALSVSVEETMDVALAARPDLAASLAELRAREADVRRTRADFWPRLGVSGSGGGTAGRFEPEGIDRRFGYSEPIYTGFLELSWTLFDGYARTNAVRQAEARRGEAEAALGRLQLETLREVWKAYADVKVAFLQLDYARALLDASKEAYDATFTGYESGLNDILDLLAAERDLARARMTLIASRAELLTSAAALAFAVGDVAPAAAP